MKTIKTIAVCTTLLMIVSACVAAGLVRPGKAPKPAGQPGQRQPEWWRPGPGNPVSRFVVHGTVLQVDSTGIQVQTVARGVVQFAITDKTRFVVGGKPGSIADVQKGDEINVKFQPVANGIPLALGIHLPKDRDGVRNRVKGKITALDGNTITVHNPRGDVKVTVGDATKIVSRRYKGSIADLRVGYEVVVIGDPASPKGIEFIPMVGKGAVTAVNGNSITVKLVRQQTIDLEAGPATAVLVRPRVGPNFLGTLADIKVGSPVDIGFHANPGGACPLLWIEVLTGI